MKTTKRYMVLLLAILMIISTVGTCVYATSLEEDLFLGDTISESKNVEDSIDAINPEEEFQPMMVSQCPNQWGATNWGSLVDAQKKYGYDFRYTALETPLEHKGKIYTHYYTFESGARMYFGVMG